MREIAYALAAGKMVCRPACLSETSFTVLISVICDCLHIVLNEVRLRYVLLRKCYVKVAV